MDGKDDGWQDHKDDGWQDHKDDGWQGDRKGRPATRRITRHSATRRLAGG
jgi:hypothetical protein